MHQSATIQTRQIDGSLHARRILRLRDVEFRTGFKRAHIYNMISQGRFPRAVQLGPRAVGWDSVAIDQWIEELISGTSLH
ncbi:AlpA family phage regulatory protein [Pseudomonas cavernicola]|uniref:AlpA family phage regulatory protein n=1 Tax=Pseudomonas cavernicola TaxID=2320866 RepID=A0A418XF01_9PSED|nr:AlpA family transcriptional regulator [Pseudomonas cavernicola]RJG11101.1 AlpA family phage regulatory protein [Pseudomonas cavernicola]